MLLVSLSSSTERLTMMVLAWFGIASPPFQHAASLLAYRCSRNLSYEVSEDEHLQLLSGEGILYNKVARKRKKCNKTNSVEFKNEGVPSRELVLTISGGFQQVDLMGQWRGASNTRHSIYIHKLSLLLLEKKFAANQRTQTPCLDSQRTLRQ